MRKLHAVSLKQQADSSAFRLELLIKVLFAGFRELALNMIHGEEQAGPNENFGAWTIEMQEEVGKSGN